MHLDGASCKEPVNDLPLCSRHGLMHKAQAVLQGMLQRCVLHLGQVRLQI